MIPTIRIAVSRHSAFYSPLLAALGGGFLEKQSLHAEYGVKPRGRSIHDLIRSGEADLVQAAVSTNWDPMERGLATPAVHFAQINQRDGFFLVAREPAAEFSWKELEGRTLLADHVQQPLAMLQYAAHVQEVEWSKIQVINAGSMAEMEAAFRSGEGDFIHLQGPAAQLLEKDGLGRIVAAVGEAMPPVSFSSLAASRDFLQTEAAAAFMGAYREALRWVNETPAAEIAAVEASLFPGLDPVALEAAIARYQRLRTWNPDPTISRDLYEQALDVFLYSNVISRRHPYEEVVVAPPGA